MTADHILSRWERVRGVMRSAGRIKSSEAAWLTLLYFARAGAAGMDIYEAVEAIGKTYATVWSHVAVWKRNGMLVEVAVVEMGKKIYAATPQAYDFLGIKPEAGKEAV